MDSVRKTLVAAWLAVVPSLIFIIGYYAGVQAERIAAKTAALQIR